MKKLIALALAALGMLAVAQPSFAQSPQTALFFVSQQGDPLGQGKTETVRPSDGYSVSATVNGSANFVSVFLTSTGSNPVSAYNWQFQMGGPNGQMPAVGTYENTTFDMYDANGPRLSQFGYSYCGGRGRYQVLELAIGSVAGTPAVTSLAVNYELRCTGGAPTFYAQLRYNSSYPLDTTVGAPDPFQIPDSLDQVPGTTIVSSPVQITGISSPLPISITGGEYSIDNGPFTLAPNVVAAGQSVRVRAVAPNALNKSLRVQLKVGLYTDEFRVATATGENPQPNGDPLLVFVTQSLYQSRVQSVRSPANSETITLAQRGAFTEIGIRRYSDVFTDQILLRRFSNDRLEIGDYEIVSTSLVAKAEYSFSGYTIPTPGCASDSASSVPASVLKVIEVAYDANGGVTKFAADLKVYCESSFQGSQYFAYIRIGSSAPIDYSLSNPLPFSFAPQSRVPVSTQIVSNEITIAGINVDTPITGTAEYSIDGGAFTSAAGVVRNGQRVRVRVTSPSAPNRLASGLLRVGERTVLFLVGSETGPMPQSEGLSLLVLVNHQNMNVPYGREIHSVATIDSVGIANDSVSGAFVYTFDLQRVGPTSSDPRIRFALPNRSTLAPGTYALDTKPASAIVDPLNHFTSTLGYGACTLLPGSVLKIHEVIYDATGQPQSLAADFVLRCLERSAAFGYVRIASNVPIDYAVRLPYQFGFTPATNAALNTLVTSNEITLGGTTVPVPISIAGGEYSIDDAPFTSAPGVIASGQRLRVRRNAPSTVGSFVTARVSVGDVTADFRVGAPVSAQPQPTTQPQLVLVQKVRLPHADATAVIMPATGYDFSLIPYTGGGFRLRAGGTAPDFAGRPEIVVQVGTPNGEFPRVGTFSQETIYLSTADSGLALCNSSGNSQSPSVRAFVRIIEIEYGVDGLPTKFAADFVRQCHNESDATYGYVRYNSNVPIDYSLTDPFPFNFLTVSSAEPGTVWVSGDRIISGINTPVPVSITGGEYSLDGGAWTTAQGTAVSGQRISLRTTAPNQLNAVATARVQVGTREESFSVGTRVGTTPQPVAGSSLIVQVSQPGEPLLLGQNFVLSPARFDSFAVRRESGITRVLVTRAFASYAEEFAVFSAPYLSPLTLGDYTVATGNSSYGGASPHMRVRGGYNDCYGSITGSFRVQDVAYSADGQITKLAVDAIQYCGSATTPLYAYIRVNSTYPITQVRDDIPTPFGFSARFAVLRNTLAVSYDLVIANVNVPVPISIVGGEYQVDNAPFTSSPGVINEGQTLRVRLRSSRLANTETLLTVTAGGVSTNFRVTTDNGTLRLPLIDFSGDGKSDILIQDGSGAVSARLVDGTTVGSPAVLIGASSGWTVTHTADFNGDGKSDILWRHTDGTTALWLMNGASLISGAGLLPAGSGWTVTHTADFNGDGKDDLLWKHTDGTHAIWLMNGITLFSGAAVIGAGTWQATHVGDFNGDGKADILWRNTADNSAAIWVMNGLTVSSGGGIIGASPWQAAHVGDFNGDGKTDILMRNTADNSAAVWLMNGFTLTGGAGIIGASPWQAIQVGDLNGDGKTDIIWRNAADGTVVAWLMNGAALTSGAALLGPNSVWTVHKLADYNGDGKADLTWQNTDGSIAIWLMDGLTVTSGASVTGPGTTRVP